MADSALHQEVFRVLRVGLLLAACALTVSCSKTASEEEQLKSARKSIQAGSYAAAQVELKGLLAANPQSAEARLLMGKALLQMGDARSAALELEKARDLGQKPSEVVPDLALALLRSLQMKRVIDSFSGVDLEDKAATAQLMAVLATAHVAQGAVDRGAALVADSLKLFPSNSMARMLDSRLLAGAGKVDEALEKTRQQAKDEPKNPEVHQLLGELLFYAKSDPVGATASLEAALAIRPKHLPAHHALINIALRGRDMALFKQRVSALKKALPKALDTLYYDAQLALSEGDLPRARELAEQLLKVAGEAPATLTLAGATEMRRGSWARAEAHLTKALQKDPDNAFARQAMARIHLRSGQDGRAMQVLAPLLNRKPADVEALTIAAEIGIAAGRIGEAEGYLQTALKEQPRDARLRSALAMVQIVKGDAKAGLAELDSLAASDKDQVADLALISARLKRGETREAQAAIERLKAKDPTKGLPHLLQGQLLARLADPAGARRAFNGALAADPGFFPAIAQLTAMDVREGKASDAVARLNGYIQKHPNQTEAHLMLADAKARSQHPVAEVERHIADAIRMEPAHEFARLTLVRHRLAQGNREGARQAAQEGVAALPQSVSLLEALAKIQFSAGERESALNILKKVNGLLPNYERGYLNLADAHYMAGDKAAAAKSIQRAIEAAPNSILGHTALVRLSILSGKHDEARATSKALQKSQPNEPAGWLLEAEVLSSLKQTSAAAEVLRAATSRFKQPGVTVALYSVLLSERSTQEADNLARQILKDLPRSQALAHRLGLTALQREKLASAEIIFFELQKHDANDALALNNLSMALGLQNKPEALGFAERANRLSADNPGVLDSLALALAVNGQAAKAIETQQLAIAKSNNNPQFRLGLAKLHLRLNQNDLARAELEKLKSLGAGFAGQAEVNSLLARL